MPIENPQQIVDRLRQFQRRIREMVIASHKSGGQHEVSRSSSADTIYKIDTEVDPILEVFCQEWGKESPLVLIAEGMVNDRGEEGPMTFPHGTREEDAQLRLIIDPIDGTRGIMYDKRAAWALAGVALNKGRNTRLRDIEIAVMTELPTSKMGFGDVLWAVKGEGARGVRERLDGKPVAYLETSIVPRELHGKPIGHVLTKMGKVADEHVVEALNSQKREGGMFGQILLGMGMVNEQDIQIALAFQKGQEPDLDPVVMSAITGEPLSLRPSQAETILHGFAPVTHFFPRTKVLAGELMEHLTRNLVGDDDVNQATVFDDQYISTGGQFYELIVGHDRFNADLRPVFYSLQNQPPGLCCHPYDCSTMLIAEEAGVILTDEVGRPLDGPLDTTTGLAWIAYANDVLRRKMEPLVLGFLKSKQQMRK